MPPGIDEPLRIRGHHLLCMFGFRGLGYSPEFVENMQAVVDAFFCEPGPEVELVAGCDAICAACPSMEAGRCRAEEGAEERVRAKDRAVLKKIGKKGGSRHNSASLVRIIVERVRSADVTAMCEGCRWLPLGYCRRGLEQFLRRAERTRPA